MPAFSEQARRRLFGLAGGALETHEFERAALLEEAERLLAQGRAGAALEALERAAMMRHAADTELAIVRALMAAGLYRRALVACAHTAGAHREQTAGAALYVWLLHIGGQELVARRTLIEALQRVPADALLLHTREQVQSDWPRPGELLSAGPGRAAPVAYAEPEPAAPAGLRAAGTAVLLNDGVHALAWTGLTGIAAAQHLWLRNGLGQTVRVSARCPLGPWPLDLLTLTQVLPAPAWEAAGREPFAGSPGSMVEYAPDEFGRAAWPLLRQGFFAGVPGTEAGRPLGISAPPGPRGGPVFDATARLVGVAVGGPQADRLIPWPALRALLEGGGLAEAAIPAAAPAASAAAGPGRRAGPEVAYEFSLRGALQVLLDERRA